MPPRLSEFHRVHALEEGVNRFNSDNAAVVSAGNFNAHLGTLAGPRGLSAPNQGGFVLKEFITIL